MIEGIAASGVKAADAAFKSVGEAASKGIEGLKDAGGQFNLRSEFPNMFDKGDGGAFRDFREASPLSAERSEFPNMFDEGGKFRDAADRAVESKSEYRPLNDSEKANVRDITGMSDSSLDRVTVNDAGEYKMSCINEWKVGEKSDVPYVEKIVNIDGVKIRVVVPEFGDKVAYECKLPDELCRAPDNKQFEACTNSLKDAIAKNPELANKFTPKQLEMINDGAPRISGYVWHHDAEKGKMQLVPSDVHNANRHTGGKAIWGGGDEMR